MPEDDVLVALLRDVDGIGATTARTIAAEFADAEDLRDAVEDIPPGYSPTRLSRLDGFGPTRARTMAKRIDESGVLDVATDGGRPRATTIVGDPQHPAETARPEGHAVEIPDLEAGDRVVIEPEPSLPELDDDPIHGEVTRAEEHTCEMAGDRGEPTVTGETLEVDAEDGQTYVRKGTGTLFVIDDSDALDYHVAVAFDSALRAVGGEGS